ncbi:MAG: phosphoribosylformylglycinamidine synthase [Flavobacteriaceae bacterium]|nr:phosphoribosylformylglycinamidine synthase [Flavobacteriaceae bacterium]
MIIFFGDTENEVLAIETLSKLNKNQINKLIWLFNKTKITNENIEGVFVGTRSTMVTPWSTNAVEITQNMGIKGISRIEAYTHISKVSDYDSMLFDEFNGLNQNLFHINIIPKKTIQIINIKKYNLEQGLSLNDEEINYLEKLSLKLERPLTDSEVFGFSQVNSEHCRHKIFNGIFILDNKKKDQSLFDLIKKTSKINSNSIISAYKDNVAFIDGPIIEQFSPKNGEKASFYEINNIKSVISLKAETHNFPTTVEPFNGAATGSGGEIRDRLAGGKGSLPMAGSAVYMTPYPRLSDSYWEKKIKKRNWLYQSPLDILIKASNGASDFGNKFGQPLITGSILTFEHKEKNNIIGYDKVIMQAGGIGIGKNDQAHKERPKKGDIIIILGGDNYRIGMGGAAVSSANTGSFKSSLELNAVQRSNPEMQKRVANVIRSLFELPNNPIISIHDHGAGGHLNCLTELIEETGGYVNVDLLPLGDPTLSIKEIIGNESQERMGLIVSKKNTNIIKQIAKRERAPYYEVGVVTDDNHFTFDSSKRCEKAIDLNVKAFFGSSPKTIMNDNKMSNLFSKVNYDSSLLKKYINNVLELESVACKDWLTNKVDRCVTGKVAQQQCVGELQLPLSNCGVMALDFKGNHGVATSIGHSPLTSLINPRHGSINSIGKALSNIIWAPLKNGIKSISLSANWMWPCNNPGEDEKLYQAVNSCSDFAIKLGINIPTGKDSLSMKQKYSDIEVKAPGTVIISAAGECSDIKNIVEPVIKLSGGSLFYIDLTHDEFKLGGSAFSQSLGYIGGKSPTIKNANYFKDVFNTTQSLIKSNIIESGHDIGAGGLITSILELCFSTNNIGLKIDLTNLNQTDTVATLFSENIAILIQSKKDLTSIYNKKNIKCIKIGEVIPKPKILIKNHSEKISLSVNQMRQKWFNKSFLLDKHQTKPELALKRKENITKQPLKYIFPKNFSGKLEKFSQNRINAAIIREKGSNSEREMAYAMYLSGFNVKDIHMTDLVEGRETLEDIHFIAAVGGFSNSDVLGSAKGWAGAFKYNDKAKSSLNIFFNRNDTLSLGVCNGCQLFVELELITPEHNKKPKMLRNNSEKFECIFTSVDIKKSKSIMLKGMEGSSLGIWAAHGEGKFSFPLKEDNYEIPAKYSYKDYPSNPNGSDYNAAMLCNKDGRHLVMMPHLERSTFPWNWGYYLEKNKNDEISPWLNAFKNAYNWLSRF